MHDFGSVARSDCDENGDMPLWSRLSITGFDEDLMSTYRSKTPRSGR